mmetsp:Transcript_33202/g.69159  ORF Transcript_33202/g.69159 Transcript_33202/m.69159 type:complete len:190 (-) Transcript_33202:225-794(-)|eukprot:CAMPEP_0172455454 /NCGR_PEP_ID=MMETSP1065-20121228/12074_1 /TAXON_ID=265537 /ORGANISM="Amphiprora paludosa, Strain CCMP125" /LENGTH=189 /DNA_ID=CAMNT_0013207915 /DNA_START=56 /DNA_END=625 /DNA_ORIENTATION=+
MAATILLNKITSSMVDHIPCCHGFGKQNDNDTRPQEESAPAASSNFIQAPIKRNKFSGKHSKYEDWKWASMPGNVKKAARALGYDKEIWDSKTPIDIDDYSWHDLTEEQQGYAETMGWTEAAWENKYEDYDWADLPKIVQEAATSVGFTQTMWDEDEWPEAMDVEWEELSKAQKTAMHVLGYVKETWDK